jgi:hypothetical protein
MASDFYSAAANPFKYLQSVTFTLPLGALSAIYGAIVAARLQIRASMRAIDLRVARGQKDLATRSLPTTTYQEGVRPNQVVKRDMHYGIPQVCEPVRDRPTAPLFESLRVHFHVPVGVTVAILAAIGYGRNQRGHLANQRLEESWSPQEALNLPCEPPIVIDSKPSLEVVHQVGQISRTADRKLLHIQGGQCDKPLQTFFAMEGAAFCRSLAQRPVQRPANIRVAPSERCALAA